MKQPTAETNQGGLFNYAGRRMVEALPNAGVDYRKRFQWSTCPKIKGRQMSKVISETEFREALIHALNGLTGFDYVTGPGRSGAIASAYASHFMGIPFVPYKCKIPNSQVLIVDTAMQSGRTLRKASRYYNDGLNDAPYLYVYHEPPRLRFWYEELSMVRGKGNEYRKAS